VRPGGLAVFATWGPLKDNSWLGIIYDALEFALQQASVCVCPCVRVCVAVCVRDFS
jgi:hypothetical protein